MASQITPRYWKSKFISSSFSTEKPPLTFPKRLSWGPAASLYVGKEAKLFTLPKRLLIYHSAVARQHLVHKSGHQPPPNTLIARAGDPRACFHIIQWMKRDTLSIVSAISSSGLQDACVLLCRMFALANDLAIPAICAPIVTELRATFALARDLGMSTPVAPGAVMEVWNVGGENSVLWKLLLEELCGAFSSTPRPVYEDYQACIGAITPLRLALGDVMGRRIYDLLERRGGGED